MIRTILKRWWNLNMKLSCYIPIVGIFARHFIVAETEKEIESKQHYSEIADSSFKIASDIANESIFKYEVKQEIIRKTGCSDNDIEFSPGLNSVRVGNGNWIDISHIKAKYLNN